MIRQVTHAWLVLLLLVVMLPAAATENTAATENSKEPYEPGTGQYLLVLIDGATGVRDSKTGKKAHEPDVAKLGGKLLEKKDNVRLIKLPVAAAKALRKEENVAYIQRIWRGEPLEDLDDEQGASSAGPRVQTDMATDLTWETGQYLYDGSGNIKKIGNDEYSYDSAGRLIQAKVKGTVETYKYDSFGNLVEKSRGGATGAINVDATSNRLTGETYDAAGNARTRNGQPWYTYDSLNMMDTTRVDEITTRRILYGPDDERIAVIHDQGLARWKIRDFEGRVLREFKDDVGSTWHWMEDYVHGEGRILGAEREEYYLGRRHMHTDHLGSVRLMTMQDRTQISGHDFYPFGEEQTDLNYEYTTWMTPGDGGNARPEPMKYTGHERDFHGWYNVPNNDYLDYMHARYYDPNRGRFLSVDPGDDVDLNSPQTWNKYAYVRSNPINATDPTGMFSMTVDVKGAIGKFDPVWDGFFQGISERVFARHTTPARSAMLRGYEQSQATMWSRFGQQYEIEDEADAIILAIGFVPFGRLAAPLKKPALSAVRTALQKVHARVGKLPKGKPGKFGSPQRGDSIRGYRLDPPHPKAKPGTPETGWHINVWDYTKGKRGKGGYSEAIPIE